MAKGTMPSNVAALFDLLHVSNLGCGKAARPCSIRYHAPKAVRVPNVGLKRLLEAEATAKVTKLPMKLAIIASKRRRRSQPSGHIAPKIEGGLRQVTKSSTVAAR